MSPNMSLARRPKTFRRRIGIVPDKSQDVDDLLPELDGPAEVSGSQTAQVVTAITATLRDLAGREPGSAHRSAVRAKVSSGRPRQIQPVFPAFTPVVPTR